MTSGTGLLVASRVAGRSGIVDKQVIPSGKGVRVPKDFRPSPQSFSPQENTLRSLEYIQKAAKALETKVKKDEIAPAWVQRKIQEAKMDLGMAVSYLQRASKKEQE